MIEMMEYFLPIFGISCMYFNYLLREEMNILALAPFIIGIVNALLPMQKINKCIFREKEKDCEDIRYDDIYNNFESTYLKENPVTRKRAMQEYFLFKNI
jgi:hypothetical protein